jgi:hypothetical protein
MCKKIYAMLVTFTLEQNMKDEKGRRGTALLFLNLDAR